MTTSIEERERPVHRYLRGYVLDPGFSTRLQTAKINEGVYRVPYEPLEPGPIGEYVEVIDFDPASDCWYEPVDLGAEEVASQHGRAPSEGDPQFHQQFVYAVVMKTIRHFERALGRKLLWLPRRRKDNTGYVARLRIYPHGFRDANAYYDPDKRALVFGYFAAAHQAQGANLPGGLVFTCLSPDIVAHEATHAILDAIHHRYIEDTNPDVAAFHEGFADIVALLQRFTFTELVEHQLAQARGRLENYTVFGELATQFGEALEGNRGALRSMIGRWKQTRGGRQRWVPLQPSPADYATHTEAHDRGAVLVATMFDVFQRIYDFRTADLLRIASQGTGILPEGSLHPDLVRRLAREACAIAEHLLHICIRALDYCPPSDIDFGNYLRALISADLDIAPEDENGYRLAIMEAFRARGIFPDRVNTFSLESLKWNRPHFTAKEAGALEFIAGQLKPLVRDLVDAEKREDLHKRSRAAKIRLHNMLTEKRDRHVLDEKEWERFLNKLGLTARPVAGVFGKASAKMRFLDEENRSFAGPPKIEVHTLRPAFRAGREGRQIEQVVITLTQRIIADIGDDPHDPRPMYFRGGCTLILSLGNLAKVEYVIVKNITSHRRFLAQRRYLDGEASGGVEPSASLYTDGSRERRLDFQLLHRH